MSTEITHYDLKKAPSSIVFFTFMNVLLKNGRASISKKSKNTYLLNSKVSNYFLVGRDELLNPFIGIQESMLPWFPEMSWTEVAVSFQKGYAYLVSRDELGNILFKLGLKIRRKRLISLIDEKNKDEYKYLNIKVFKNLLDGEVAISHKNIKKDLKVYVIKDIEDIEYFDGSNYYVNEKKIVLGQESIYKVNLQGYDKEATLFNHKTFFINCAPSNDYYKNTLSLINTNVMEGYGYNVLSKSFQNEFIPFFIEDYINKNKNNFKNISETGTYKLVLNLNNNPN